MDTAHKNIQVIDGAINCEYPIYAATPEEFEAIFPLPEQDLELVEDFIDRVGEAEADRVLGSIWDRPVDKKSAYGIQGTLFYERGDEGAYFPPSRREADWQEHTRNRLINGV